MFVMFVMFLLTVGLTYITHKGQRTNYFLFLHVLALVVVLSALVNLHSLGLLEV